MKLKTGPADFWKFFALREDARRRREAGGDPPYSDDPILARYHFCNVFREADSGTKYFQRFRARTGRTEASRDAVLPIVLWQACLYRPINRIETFEAFRKVAPLGSPFVAPGYSAGWIQWLRHRFNHEDAKVFTGRHLNRGLKAYVETVRYMERHFNEVAQKIANADACAYGLEDVVASLRQVPGIGPFFGWQIACDLVESKVITDDPSWAQLGPGAIRGARLVANDPGLRPAACLDTAKWLVETQDRFAGDYLMEQLALWWRFPVVLKDIEHALCEYVRYVQARDGNPTLEVKPWAK